ncbi:MAG: hypothetical protein IIB00_07100 [candidate division Zixibacteria bacterium]|nr:hypothetical protein [candidate division Zixibacteria bacterium]
MSTVKTAIAAREWIVRRNITKISEKAIEKLRVTVFYGLAFAPSAKIACISEQGVHQE